MNERDPWAVLHMSPDASEERIRARFELLEARCKTDDERESLRDAYESAMDPRTRAYARVVGPPPLDNLAELELWLRWIERRPVSLESWLQVID